MLRPWRALFNPTFKGGFLRIGQRFMRSHRRHTQTRFGVIDALQNQTFKRLASNNGLTIFALLKRTFASIQAQSGHPRTLIRAMTKEAGIRKDGTDFALKINGTENVKGRQKQQQSRAKIKHEVVSVNNYIPFGAKVQRAESTFTVQQSARQPS